MFEPKRLSLARERRGHTGVELAKLSGITSITISRLENGQTENPDPETVERLAVALNFPVSFFSRPAPEKLDDEIVSFRSLKKMNAKQKNAALGAGSLGLELYDWVEAAYRLPVPKIPDHIGRQNSPESAARVLRQEWGLGERPIGNVLHLLESKGVRVLSLEEANKNVDAFSFWRDDKPFVFLNTFKTAEHSVFDCAHELGHLVLHRHGGPMPTKPAEVEANDFASSFLMPEHDVKAAIPRRLITPKRLIEIKRRWRVSAMALARRLYQIELLSPWQYRSMCIELGKLGYRTDEPDGIEREKSLVWKKILTDLWSKRSNKADIGAALDLPFDEVERLVFRLAGDAGERVKGCTLRELK